MSCNGPKEYNVLFQMGAGKDTSRWSDITFSVTIDDLPCGASADDAKEMARQEAEAKLAKHCKSTGKGYLFKEVYDA